MKHCKGFTVIELALVASIIGILAALAIPLYKNTLVRSRISAFTNDLRVHSESIRRFAIELGEYPNKSDIEKNQFGVASRLDRYLSPTWYEPTPIGGSFYLKINDSIKGYSMRNLFIEVSGDEKNPLLVGFEDLMKLDKKIDDGMPGSGFFRISGERIRYFLVVNE